MTVGNTVRFQRSFFISKSDALSEFIEHMPTLSDQGVRLKTGDVMQFVVPIPLWLYVLFLLFAFYIGAYVFTIAIVLGFISFLFTVAPKATLGFIIFMLTLKYWQIIIPIIIIAMLFSYFSSSDSGSTSNKRLTKIDTENLDDV